MPKAASLSHAESQGLSIFRDGHASNREILENAEQLVIRARQNNPNQKVGVFGVLLIPCQVIRTHVGQGEDDPCYCVYDTAEKDKLAHGEAFQRIAGVDKSIQDARRNALFEKLRVTFVPVAQFRDGFLAHLAPPQ